MAVTWKKIAYEDNVILKALLTAHGDIIYASGVATPAVLAHGTDGQVLTLASSLPSWAAGGAGASTFLALTDTPANYTGSAKKAAVVNDAENALVFADPIPLATAWKGSFNWDTSVYTDAEIDISALFSTDLALTTRRKYTVYLDLTNVEADASFVSLYLAVKTKIDGTNYRAIDRKTILKADIGVAAEPGIIISISAVAENIQITMWMSTALGADVTIYYAVVKEHLE